MLAALDGLLDAVLALDALHPQHDLLRGLRLLAEDRLRLSAEALLLSVVTASTLKSWRG